MPRFEQIKDDFGVTVTDLDTIAQISDADFDHIRRTIAEKLLVVLRGQHPGTAVDLRNLGARFGPLNTLYRPDVLNVPEAPEVIVLSNVEELKAVGANAELEWHTNLSYEERVASIALLQGIQTPPPEAGGGTSFVNLAGAYAALDDATKSEIEGMQVLRRHKAFFNDPNPEFFQTEQAHSVISPLVRRAPLSGKPTLYDIGDRWWVSIVGLSRPKSDALRRRLFEHSTQERFKYAHRWQPGDLIIWDNISTMHRRDEFDNSYTRICRVLDVMEEVPSGKSPVHAASQERPLSV